MVNLPINTLKQHIATSQAFPRDVRLLSSELFKSVFNKNHRALGRNLVILARPNDCGFPRLGLAIAKKQVKLSVDRNRVKRVVREYFRLHQATIPACDYIVLARFGLKDASNAELNEQMRKAYRYIQKQIDAEKT